MSTLRSIQGEVDLWYDPSNGIIHFRTYINRKRISRSTRVRGVVNGVVSPAALRKARAEARRIQDKILDEHGVKKGTKRFEDHWLDWIEARKSQWSKVFVADLISMGNLYFLPQWGHRNPNTITHADFNKWVEKVREEKNSPVMTLRKHKDALTMFLNYLHQNDVISKAPKLNNPDRLPAHRKTYTSEEIERLLSNAKPKLRLQIQMGYRMGMRRGEILGLAWDRIDWKDGFIRLKAGDTKTKMPRAIPIPEDIMEALYERLKADQATPYVFPQLRSPMLPMTSNSKPWIRCKRKADVSGRFHELRHTCATQMAASNISPAIACRILGMSLAIYDRVYCRPTDDQIKNAFNNMHWEA
jgi:integrase